MIHITCDDINNFKYSWMEREIDCQDSVKWVKDVMIVKYCNTGGLRLLKEHVINFSDRNYRETEIFEFRAISRLHTFSETGHWFFRWLFYPSQRSSRNLIQSRDQIDYRKMRHRGCEFCSKHSEKENYCSRWYVIGISLLSIFLISKAYPSECFKGSSKCFCK